MVDKKYKVTPANRIEAFHISEDKADQLLEAFTSGIDEHKMEMLFDVFVVKDGKHEKIISKGETTNSKFLEKLKENHEDIYIPIKQKEHLVQYIKENMSKTFAKRGLSVNKKSKILYSDAVEIVRELFEKPIDKKTIDGAKKSIGKVIDSILTGNVTLSSLLEVTSYDYYTYTHSVDVAFYSVALAKYLGLDKKAIVKVGEAGILHDIGKTKIDINIVNKNGKLIDEEFEIMKKHPELGYDILVEQGERDPYILQGVMQHHEKIDGNGYPYGLKGKQINPISMIISCADIFDALTTRRSYKEPMTSFDALDIMHNQMLSGLNRKMLEKFIVMMGEKTI